MKIKKAYNDILDDNKTMKKIILEIYKKGKYGIGRNTVFLNDTAFYPTLNHYTGEFEGEILEILNKE